MPWFRLYTEILDDPKTRDFTGDQFRNWIYLLCLARESDTPGTIHMSIEDIAWRIRRPCEEVKESIEIFTRRGMVEIDDDAIIVTHFQDRQYDNPSDKPEATRERKRKSRECHEDVTTMSRPCHEDVTTCHALDTDTDTDIYSTTTPLPPSFKEGESVVVVDEIDVEAEKREVTKFMTNSFIIGASAFQVEMLTNWIDDGMRADAIIYAMEIALAANKREPRYVKGILKKWFEAGVRTRKQAEEFVRQQGARAQPEKDKDKNNAPRGVVYYDAAEELAKLKRRTGS